MSGGRDEENTSRGDDGLGDDAGGWTDADDLAAFEDIVSSAYEEYEVVFGRAGDPQMVPATPAVSRPCVDLGVAGSLTQTRRQLTAERRARLGPVWSDPKTIVPSLLLIAAAGCAVLSVTVKALPGNPWLVVPAAAAVIAVSVAWLWVRRGWSAAERSLFRTEVAETQAATELGKALKGTSWVVLHDRLLPGTEHRVAFLAVGPAGVAILTLVPRGPYLVSSDGLRAGEEELTASWLPTRTWETRSVLEALGRTPTRDLVFRGPVYPVGVVGYLSRKRIPSGWMAVPPLRLGVLPIRNAPGTGQLLRSLPGPLGPVHVQALVDLVDDLCPPAPTA